MLYHPHLGEIRHMIQRGIDKNPSLKSRFEKAEQILLNHDLRYSSNGWQCYSQSEQGRWYSISRDEHGCSCADFQRRGAVVKGRSWCKHLLALRTYREILTGHFAKRIWGNTNIGMDRKTLKLYPNAILLQSGHHNEVMSGVTHQQNIHFAYDNLSKRRDFKSDYDLYLFACWLHDADPLPPAPMQEEASRPPQRINEAAWSREEWDYYYNTGKTPAMVKVYEMVR